MPEPLWWAVDVPPADPELVLPPVDRGQRTSGEAPASTVETVETGEYL